MSENGYVLILMLCARVDIMNRYESTYDIRKVKRDIVTCRGIEHVPGGTGVRWVL